MKSRVYGARFLWLMWFFIGVSALAQTPTADQLNALKSMSKDEQNALIQSITGQGTGTTKTDQKLNMPETIRSKPDQATLDELEKLNKEKTSDGRRLRQPDENPELRADDSVLIELISCDEEFGTGAYPGNQNGPNAPNGPNGGNPPNGANGLSGLDAIGAATGANAAGRNNALGAVNGGTYPENREKFRIRCQNARRPDTDEEKTKSEEEKHQIEEFRQRILRNNPYRLNRFGVLELPGLPSIPLAGLTAEEASARLSADPDLRDYDISLTLLRLQPFGDEALKPFGYDLFEGVPSTFAPVSDIQVPLDYLVGPGDTLNIQLYGNEPASYMLTVGRDGRINFPKLGPISLNGMSFEAARAAIEQRVAQQLIGSRVSVTIGELRSIRVFVLGEADKPGSYTVSGLSTMTNALFVSGGVKKVGSLRKIELKRNGKLITVLDLYDLLLHGDTSGDRQLMPGDVIFIPPIGNTVSVDGAVRRPAIYELKQETTAEQAIELAGGLTPDADQRLVQDERILPSRLREMVSIDLTTTAGRDAALGNGDKLRVPMIRPTLENSVVLSGYVLRPGSFEYHPGLRLSDIIGSFDELRPNADPHYIMIRREVPPQERIEVVSADLARALSARGTAADVELRPRDKIIVFDLSSSRDRILAPIIQDLELQATPDKPAQVVNIDGRVKSPGRYPLEPMMRVSDLIRAGGSLEDAAYLTQAELTRYEVVNGKSRQTDFISIDLSAVRRADPAADLRLRPYDVLVVKVIPLWDEPGTIVLAGEVRFPGKYPIHRGETLYSALQRAGGFTDIAFGEGSVFIREELKKREKDQLELLTNRLQSDLTSLSLEALASSATSANPNASSGAAQGLAVGQQLLDQLRKTKPVGRLVINVDRIVRGPPGAPGDVVLRDGDKLFVPKKNQEITILGEVQSPTSHVFQAGLSRDDYISRSGGVTQKADRKRIYVVRANGDVISGERQGWFHRTQSTAMRPGDTIVVPLDTERVRALPLWQSVTTIMYNIAISILALRYL